MPSTADLTHPQGNLFEYEGALVDSSGNAIASILAGLSASGVFDGGAPTSTGITVAASDIPGRFTLSVTAAAMNVADQAVITISATGAQDLVLTIRTGVGRTWRYGRPSDVHDRATERCEETGLLCPPSRMKVLDGKYVVDWVDHVTLP